MVAPSKTAGQFKYGPRNAFDGLRVVLPASAASVQAAPPRISAFDGLIIAPPVPAEPSIDLPYDVFINHRGEDVKYTIASSIYNKLTATGLRVFLDKNELKLGDFFPAALEEAIRRASIHIAIFSQNYADSPWCLAELACMLQTRSKFIPIFYHVEPFSLKWAIKGKGIYADAFSKHEKNSRYTSDKLQSWKLALHNASLHTGETIYNQGDEEKPVMKVVNSVLKELKKEWLDVAKHPVGLDEAEQDFHDTIALQPAPGPIQIVGIYGMGGAGKTTLAKHLYNKKCSTFNKSSFLSDVREVAKNNRLHEKQKELLKVLDLESTDFQHVDRGKEILKSRLRSVSVLIVIDDVDHIDQLDALLPASDNLGHGSFIIVTTRELSVLRAGGISTKYKMRTLNPSHADELFCLHAFRQSSPFSGFESLAKEFVDACHRLPLSLKVLGGLLCGKYDENYWQSQLDKLSRIVPDDIKSRLKISYDALDKEEKEMFLDVACFFIGWTSSQAIEVWDGSGWTGLHGLQRLVEKSLVELDADNNIRMHDHLRDLGREIANQHSPYRLWSRHQIIEIGPQQEAIQIRGIVNAIGNNCYTRQRDIIIKTNHGERSLQPASLGLKIFIGQHSFINEERRELSRELLCFRCRGFKHQNLPSWLSMKKLRILELYGALGFEDLWGCGADAPLQLRELVIQYGLSKGFRGFPKSIAHLKNLRKIIINGTPWSNNPLRHLPEEFCHLPSLEYLQITRCEYLSYLPSNFGNLTNLQHLDLKASDRLKTLPDSLKKLTLLEYLNLSNCKELTIKPGSHIFENMIKMKYLNLQGCGKLEDLRLPKAVSLTKLYIGGTRLKALPANIFRLTKLTELEIGGEFLTVLPTCLGNSFSLTKIRIEGCKKLESLPDSLEHLNCLKDLYISNSGVKCLPKSLVHLQRLEIRKTPISELSCGPGCMLKTISLQGTKVSKISLCGDCCPFLETLDLYRNEELRELEVLPATLKSLHVYDCKVLEDITGVRGLKKLKQLRIRGCGQVDGLPNFAELESLETFELTGCRKVKKIAGLQELRSLQTLSTIQLDGLPGLAESTSLRTFELKECDNLKKVEGLETLQALEYLKIVDCPKLDGLLSVAQLTSLKKIELGKCNKKKVEGLGSLQLLENLKIIDCPELDGLPSLGELTSLKEFELGKCGKLKKVEGLGSLQFLENLKIIDCPELDGLPSLAELTSLKKIELGKCGKLKKVEGLGSLQFLENLKIIDCPELEGLPSLAELTSLKKIELEKCGKLKKVEGLGSLQLLENIKIIDCPELDGLQSLGELTSLKEFELGNCSKLKKVEGLESLQLLEILKIIDCPELDGLQSLGELTSLKEFELRRCGKLKKVEGLRSLQLLENLKIFDCPELDGLPSLGELTSLKEFELGNCNKLKKVEEVLESLGQLKALSINDCCELDTLPNLAKLTHLKSIHLKNCSKLKKIVNFESLGSLEILKIYDCPVLDGLPSLEELISLETFELTLCHKLKKIDGLESLKSLKNLRVHYCTELNSLPSLTQSTILKQIELKSCNQLEKIESFRNLRSLEMLCIEDCSALNTLPSLAELTSLQQIKLKNCNKLKKIEGLEQVTSLKKLEVHSSWKGQSISGLECNERLESLAVISNQRLVVEPFIDDIQRWPREMMVCTRAAIDVHPLKNVVEFGSDGLLNLTREESSANANAILICFSLDSTVCPETRFQLHPDRGNYFNAELANGKWVWMGVFPEGSTWPQSNRYTIRAWSKGKDVEVKEAWLSMGKDVEVKEAWLLMGNQGSIVEAFHQLSQR